MGLSKEKARPHSGSVTSGVRPWPDKPQRERKEGRPILLRKMLSFLSPSYCGESGERIRKWPKSFGNKECSPEDIDVLSVRTDFGERLEGWEGPVNVAIEIRKKTVGKIQARRSDGKPLTERDRTEARRLAVVEELPPGAWVVKRIQDGETLRAAMIYSEILEDHFWLLIDRSFEPQDD